MKRWKPLANLYAQCSYKIFTTFLFSPASLQKCFKDKDDELTFTWRRKFQRLTFSNINFFIASCFILFDIPRNCFIFFLNEIRLCLLFGNWNSYFALNFCDKYLCLIKHASRSEIILNINFQATTPRHLLSVQGVESWMKQREKKKNISRLFLRFHANMKAHQVSWTHIIYTNNELSFVCI